MTDANVSSNGRGDEPSSSLLNRVRAFDQAAWERLVDLYSPLVYGWCRQAALQPADAEDIGQKVFLAVARNIAEFRRDRPGDSFRAWVRAIARNKINDHRRRQAGEPTEGGDALQDFVALPEESDDELAKEEGILYRRAVDLIRMEFEPQCWQAFWQVVVDGRAPSDVASDLKTTPNVVYLAKSRVLRRLREEFADLVEL